MASRKKYVLRGRREDVLRLLVSDIRKLRQDKDYVVTVERLKEPVSDAQRGLFWIWMEIMANDIGTSKEDVYERYVKDSPVLNGYGISEISDEEMTGVMTGLQQYLAEWGYHLPSGHDEWYEMLEKQQASLGRLIDRSRGGKGE